MRPSSPAVVILGAARTPIGRYGGTLRSTHPAELGARAARAALERAGVGPADVDEVLIGHARQAGSGPNPARQVGRRAGLPDEVPAQTINQACASGLQAIALGAQAILTGQSNIVLAGGIESMSRMPYLVDSEDARWGHKMGNFALVDAMYRDGFFCPLSNLLMGQTAEVLAREYGISARQSDDFALESQQKRRSRDRCRPLRRRNHAGAGPRRQGKAVELTTDEHPRAGTTIEVAAQAAARSSSRSTAQAGIITAGHVVGHHRRRRRGRARERGRSGSPRPTPLGRLVGWATAGVDPRIDGNRPGAGGPQAAGIAPGWQLDDFDLVELNEAFAPQVLAVLKDLPIDPRTRQRQRRRDRARPPDWRHRHAHSRDPASRDGSSRRPARARDPLRQRRSGDGGRGREGMIIGCAGCSYRRRRHRQGRHR